VCGCVCGCERPIPVPVPCAFPMSLRCIVSASPHGSATVSLPRACNAMRIGTVSLARDCTDRQCQLWVLSLPIPCAFSMSLHCIVSAFAHGIAKCLSLPLLMGKALTRHSWESQGVPSCSVLQCVAVCCSVLQCVAVCCIVLQCLCSWESH